MSNYVSAPNSQVFVKVFQYYHAVVDGLTTIMISQEKNIAFIYSVLPRGAKRLELLQNFFNFEFVAFFVPHEHVVNIDSLFAEYSK